MGVGDEQTGDLPARVAHDRVHVFGMILGAGIEHHDALIGLDQVGVGAEIRHRARVIGHDTTNSRHNGQLRPQLG